MTHYRFPVEAGQIMLFARAVGDPNPVYHDPEAAGRSDAGGIIAPPTFVMAGAHYDPGYPLRPRPDEPWFGSARDASGVAQSQSGGAVHGEQHFTYHRQVRPGDVLTVATRPGRTWQKASRRGGTLHLSEMITEYRDEGGEPVVTARTVVVRPEPPSEGAA